MGKTTYLRTWVILTVGVLFGFGVHAQELASADMLLDAVPKTTTSLSSIVKATITGTVTDPDGLPLEGVTVLVKGTTTGALTGSDGKFTINAPDGASALLFSYIGYDRQEIALTGQVVINISLVPNVSSLDEVVVVGYGTQERRVVTGSISSISAEALERIPVGSGLEAMQGQVAGVDIRPSGGRPGQAASVQIRGRRSISASNDPLYVIDGIPMTSTGSGGIFDINPQDIASMEVLKDAASTAIYGSRGANGVILITTKRGNSGKTTVAYDSYYGLTNALRRVDMMDGQQFADMKRESRRIDPTTNQAAWNGQIPADEVVFLDPIELTALQQSPARSTDYQDLILGQGSQTNHQLSVRGGTAKTLFNISLGLFGEQGVISNQDFQRISTRVNVDHTINKVFKVGTSTMISYSTQNWGSNATLGEAVANNPLGRPYADEAYDGSGNLVNPDDDLLLFLPTNDGIRTNPLSELVPGAYIDERTVGRVFPSIYVEAKILDGLTFRTNVGTDIRFRRDGVFRGSLTNSNRGGPASANLNNRQDIGYTWENILTYKANLGEVHSLGITALQSIQANTTEWHQTGVSNLPFETASFYALNTAEVKGNLFSRIEQWQLASFMGRVNYEISGKYLFSATLRADGSSRLAPGNQWTYFPGVSAGWRISDEDFLSGASALDELKLRASYGSVGNTSIDPYQTQGRLRRTVYAWDEAAAFGFGLSEIPNPDLGWEISTTTDVGLDFGFGNGRITGSFDFFLTNTTDILLERNLPYTSGYRSVLQNIGSTRTMGQELSINANVFSNPDGFNWNINFNISRYTEQITELALKDENGDPLDDVGNGWFIGQPIEAFFNYEKIGIWQADEAEMAQQMEAKVPGEIKLKDQDGDGVITPDDRVIIGTDVPDFYGGLTNTFNYKGIDLSFFLYFKYGQEIFSNFHSGNNALFARYNNLDVDYWTIDNPTNEAPRPNLNQERPRDGSTQGYFDGSFLKLRNVTLGYSLPEAVTSKLRMSNLRIYTSVQNALFFATYPTYDPENAGNVDSGDVPTSRLALIGLNIQF